MDDTGKKELLAMLDGIIDSECNRCVETNKTTCRVCNKVETYRKAIKLIRGNLSPKTILAPKILCVLRRAVMVCDDLAMISQNEVQRKNAEETREQLRGILAGKA